MRSLLIFLHIILVIVTDLSVNGHPDSDRQNDQVYDQYYYYDDEYYYADELATGSRKQQPTNSPSSTKATEEKDDSLSEAKEAIAQYDIDELVKAWREYMEEKDDKEQTEETAPPSNPRRRPSGRRRPADPSGNRRPANRHRLRPTGGQRGGFAGDDYDEPIHTAPPRRRRPTSISDYDDSFLTGPPRRRRPFVDQTAPRRRRPSQPRQGRPRTRTTTTTLPPPTAQDDLYYDDNLYYDDLYDSKFNKKDYESEYECAPLDQTYSTPDPVQCDKYYECNIKGEEKEKLCIDGYVYDINAQHCDYPSKVNCTGRPKLQPPQPAKNCPRQNGFFPFPAEESCQKFWDCRGGRAYLQQCAAGVIFDPKIDACTTPDQSARPECAAGKVLGFECPKYDNEEILRFGNHDRLASPTSCQQFFSCLRTGQPRLGACPKKTVFNEATGHCDDPANVKGCENYWKDKEEEDFNDYYDY